jgi:hypothetical protein
VSGGERIGDGCAVVARAEAGRTGVSGGCLVKVDEGGVMSGIAACSLACKSFASSAALFGTSRDVRREPGNAAAERRGDPPGRTPEEGIGDAARDVVLLGVRLPTGDRERNPRFERRASTSIVLATRARPASAISCRSTGSNTSIDGIPIA